MNIDIDKAKEIVVLLYKTARELWSATLNTSPAGIDRMEKMRDLKKGDLVIEISSFGLRDADSETIFNAIGYLESWSDSNYLIKKFDGKLFKWSNADFIKIPI